MVESSKERERRASAFAEMLSERDERLCLSAKLPAESEDIADRSESYFRDLMYQR